MEVKLKLVSKNQILRLAFKTALLIYLAFSYNYYDSFFYFLAFWSYLLFFYFKPSLNSGKYLKHITALVLAFLLQPEADIELGVIFAVVFGLSAGFITGVKNLTFIRRAGIHFLVNILIIFISSLTLLYGGSGILGNLIMYAVVFALAYDWYKNIFNFTKEISQMFASFIALVFLEMIIAFALFPVYPLVRIILAIGGIVAINQLMVRAKEDRLDKKFLVRTLVVSFIFTVFLIIGGSIN